MSTEPPRGYDREARRAGDLIGRPERLARVLDQAGSKLDGGGGWSSRFRQLRGELALLIELTRCWIAGDYRDVSRMSLLSIVAAIAYFVNPFDVIPDFLLGFGLVDDAAVLSYVLSRVGGELDKFRRWKSRRETDSA